MNTIDQVVDPVVHVFDSVVVVRRAEKMSKSSSCESAQLLKHSWLIPDISDAYMELDRDETIKDCCSWHPLAGVLVISFFLCNQFRRYIFMTSRALCLADM